MRIVISTNMLSPYWIPVFDLLSKQYKDLTVIVGTEQESNRNYESSEISSNNFNIKLSRARIVDVSWLLSKKSHLHIPLFLLRDLILIRPDVVISNELGLRTIISAFYSKITRKPLIIWFCCSSHTERSAPKWITYIRKILINNASACITNASEAVYYISNKLEYPVKSIFQAPYSSTKKEIWQRNFDSDKRKFLFVGQIIERKGIEQLIRALYMLHGSDLSKMSITFIGGNLNEDYRERLRNIDVDFIELGFVQPSQIQEYYLNHEIFIFPSLEDEWGIVNHEAVINGMPCLSSIYAASTRELICDGINGYSVDPHNSVELADRMSQMINMDSESLKLMSDGSYEMSKRISVEKSTMNIVDAIRYSSGSIIKS